MVDLSVTNTGITTNGRGWVIGDLPYEPPTPVIYHGSGSLILGGQSCPSVERNDTVSNKRILANVYVVNIVNGEVISIGPIVANDEDHAKMKALINARIHSDETDEYYLSVDVLDVDVPAKPEGKAT